MLKSGKKKKQQQEEADKVLLQLEKLTSRMQGMAEAMEKLRVTQESMQVAQVKLEERLGALEGVLRSDPATNLAFALNSVSGELKEGILTAKREIEEVHKLRASSEAASGEITSLHSQLQREHRSFVRTSELAALSDILAALNNSETEGTPEAGSSRIALVGVFTNICETS